MNDPILNLLSEGTWQLWVRLQSFDGAEATDAVVKPVQPGEVFFEEDFAGARWEVSVETRGVPDREGALDLELTARVVSGVAPAVNAGLELVLRDWSQSTYLLLPAAAYNGNRYTARYQDYPPIAMEAEDVQLNPAPMITDVPRLSAAPGEASHLQILTGDVTTPCIAFLSPSKNHGLILLTDQGGPYGNHGLHVMESADRHEATLRVEAPGVRSRLYRMMNTAAPSWDHGVPVAAGQAITVRIRLIPIEGREVQAMFDRFAEVRQDLTGPVTLHHRLPFSAAWEIQEAKYNEHNWNPAGYYAVGIRESFESDSPYAHFSDWQAGWVGGAISTYPLLMLGNAESRERVVQTLEWIFSQAQSPESGLIAPIMHNGVFRGDHFRDPEKRWVMVRKNADVLYFLIKHFQLLEKQDSSWKLPAAWRAGTRKLCDRFVALFDAHRQLGQFLDYDTGAIVVGGSTAAGIAPAALALAGQTLRDPTYVETAEALAKSLCERDLRRGVTTGGPGEILQCPDSESAFGLLESLVVLHEVTGEAEWLPRALAMARQCMTWCASYDYRFPPSSWFGRLDMRAAGSVWANVQNKHSAPGICTLSGDSLFRLWRYTGDEGVLELIREIAHNLPQYLSREDRPVGEAPAMRPGWMCERVNFSDWEGVENIGGSLFGSCWCEVSLMLTAAEIPGLYVQPDTGRVVAFDHVDAVVVHAGENFVTVRLFNPTKFPASVSVMVERAADARQRLGTAILWGCRRLDIPAGGSRTETFR